MASSSGRIKAQARSKSNFVFGSSTERDLSYYKDVPKAMRAIGVTTSNKDMELIFGPKDKIDMKKVIRAARSITPSRSHHGSDSKKLIFGSSTPRDLSYCNKVPQKQAPQHVMPDKPVILNGSNKKATSTISKVKALPILDKNIQPQLHSPKPLFSSAFNLRPDHFSIANNEEDDDEVVSLSPASEPDLSGSDRKTSFFTEQLKLYPHFQYHKKPAPELDSQVKVHQAGEFAVPQNPFLNQQTLPAYRFHESPSITQLMSDDRSLLLQNDTEQIKAMEKCEEEVSCENRVNLDCLK